MYFKITRHFVANFQCSCTNWHGLKSNEARLERASQWAESIDSHWNEKMTNKPWSPVQYFSGHLIWCSSRRPWFPREAGQSRENLSCFMACGGRYAVHCWVGAALPQHSLILPCPYHSALGTLLCAVVIRRELFFPCQSGTVLAVFEFWVAGAVWMVYQLSL